MGDICESTAIGHESASIVWNLCARVRGILANSEREPSLIRKGAKMKTRFGIGNDSDRLRKVYEDS